MAEAAEIDVARPAGALGTLRSFDERVQHVEVILCAVALGIMILLAFLQVVLRQLQGDVFQPVGWFDNITRLLVIWVGMLGASVATAEGRHISIEAVPKLLGPTGRRRLALFVNVIACAVTALMLAVAMVYLLRQQIPDENHLFIIRALGDYKVYRWPFLLVVPWGLFVISARFALHALEAAALDDQAFAALQHDEGDEVAAVEERQQEQGTSLILDHARQVAMESGVTPGLDAKTARSELQEALRSDRWQPPQPVSTGQPPRLVGRTTDELTTYQDLNDEADLVEPEHRKSAGGEVLESGDMMGSDSDLTDELSEDDELGEADTRRAETAETPASEPDEEPATDLTERLPQAELPPPADEPEGRDG